jgi:hypothetical protein
MMTLEELIADAVKAALSSDAIKDKVQKATEKAVSESIDSAFSYNSAFRKHLGETIAGLLPVTHENDLARFSQAVREVVKLRLQTCASETAAAHVGSAIDALLPDDPIIYLSDFREAYRDFLREESRSEHCHCDNDEEPELRIKPNEQ